VTHEKNSVTSCASTIFDIVDIGGGLLKLALNLKKMGGLVYALLSK
jgi:hypothetical protein